MALHKLDVNQFHVDNYSLIALHCTLEDYRVAFLLNTHLHLNLKRLKKDLDFEYTAAAYPIFEWHDEKQQMTWNLVGNICKKEEDSLVSSGTLFNNKSTIIRTFNLIPEFKNVNYLLKIQNEANPIKEKLIISKIHSIPHISAVYSIDVDELKSRDNLIFN